MPGQPSDQQQQNILGRVPIRTLQYFCMYFLSLPADLARGLPKAALIGQLLHAGKGKDAITLYQEADSYIIHFSAGYEFYLWYEQEVACRYVAIEEVLHLLDETEYFGRAVCVMLMECGEVAISGGMLYALKRQWSIIMHIYMLVFL